VSSTKKQRAAQNRRYRATAKGRKLKAKIMRAYRKRLAAAKKLAEVTA
jgi:hypothetical protein